MLTDRVTHDVEANAFLRERARGIRSKVFEAGQHTRTCFSCPPFLPPNITYISASPPTYCCTYVPCQWKRLIQKSEREFEEAHGHPPFLADKEVGRWLAVLFCFWFRMIL